MKIFFRQSGGFSGQIRGCELDDDELDASEARELRRLVEHSGIDAPFESRDPGVRDAEVYELLLDREGKEIRVRLDEASLTERVAPLVEYLQDRAGPRGLDDPPWSETGGSG